MGNAMINTKLLILPFIALTLVLPLANAANATSCGTLPSSINSLLIGCYPANIVNPTGTATIGNFVMAFNSLPFNALAGNVVVYNGLSGSLMNAWIESNSLIWVNLGANTISASSSANGIYYFGLGNSTANFFSSTFGNDIGEAPQYSGTYGAYDNGNTVFTAYCAFVGASLCLTIYTYAQAGIQITPNNGWSITAINNPFLYAWLQAPIPSVDAPFVTDVYETATPSLTTQMELGTSTSTDLSSSSYGSGYYLTPINSELFGILSTATLLTGYTAKSQFANNNYKFSNSVDYKFPSVLSLEWLATGKEIAEVNYTLYNAYDANVAYSSTSYTTFGENGGSPAGTFAGNWIRARVAPPAGIMPSVTYLGLQSGAAYTFISSTASATAYETSSQTLTVVVSIPTRYATANMLLQMYNGVSTSNVAWNNQTTNAIGYNYFTFTYTVPLLSSNAITYTFNPILYTTSPLINRGTVTAITQTEYENYLPAAKILYPTNPSNVLIGDNLIFNTIINQVYNLNGITAAGYIQIGNKQVGEITVGQYNYLANVISFIPSSYGLAMPTTGSPVNLIANSILQLTFNGNSVYRNVTGIAFQIYNESLGTCTSPYITNSINWRFYSASTLTLWPQNVLVQGYLQSSLNAYVGNVQSVTHLGFTNPGTANVYSTCIYPSWGRFNVTGSLQYNGISSIVSNYKALQLPATNSVLTQYLYMEYQPAPVDYDIFVLNQQNQIYVPALVYIYSYNINTNTSVLISQISVPSQAGAPVTLEAGNSYTFTIYSPNGQTNYGYINVQPYVASQCASQPCSHILSISTSNPTNPVAVYGDITTSCNQQTTGTNQITLSCNFASISGKSYNFLLQGYQNGIIQGTPICNQTVTASSGTLSCTFSNTTTSQYYWKFVLNQNGAYSPLQNGYIGTSTNRFGNDSIWFGMLVILTLVMLFLSRSILMSIIIFDAGFTGMSFIDMIPSPGFPLIPAFVIIVSAVILYLANKKG
jgi:hypothetical protein